MKKTALAAACLGACACALAQSNVTVFGTVDLFIGHARSGPTSLTRLEDGGNAASRIGFRGSEDLGGGLRANFLLESGFAPDTGLGTLPGPAMAFTRQAYVGLSGPWGQVDAGRMYTPMFFALFRADPFGVNALFSPLNLVAATDAQPGLRPFAARASNMVRYRTLAGQAFFADIAYAPGEAAAPSRRSGDVYGGNVGWQGKSLYLAYAFQRAREGSAAAPVAFPSTSTYQSLSGAYQWTALKLFANYMRNSSSLQGVPKAQIASVGASYAITPVSMLLAEAAYRKVDGSDRAQLAWTLGYDHALSKRTAVYGRLLRLSNRGNASVSMAQVPVIANSGDGVRVIAAGIRHHF